MSRTGKRGRPAYKHKKVLESEYLETEEFDDLLDDFERPERETR